MVAPARTASAEEALFYVIRKDYPPHAWTGELTVNDKAVATVKDGSYVTVNLPVGKTELALKFAPLLGFSNAPFHVDVKPNETRYILLTGDVSHAGYDYRGVLYKWSLNAVELDSGAAKELIEKLGKH